MSRPAVMNPLVKLAGICSIIEDARKSRDRQKGNGGCFLRANALCGLLYDSLFMNLAVRFNNDPCGPKAQRLALCERITSLLLLEYSHLGFILPRFLYYQLSNMRDREITQEELEQFLADQFSRVVPGEGWTTGNAKFGNDPWNIQMSSRQYGVDGGRCASTGEGNVINMIVEAHKLRRELTV